MLLFFSLSLFFFFFPNMQFHDIFLRVWYYKRLEWDWQHETRANDMIWTRNVAVCFLTAQPTGCPWANYFIAQPYGLVRLRLPRLQMWQTLFVFLWHYFSQLINRNLIHREYKEKKKRTRLFLHSFALRYWGDYKQYWELMTSVFLQKIMMLKLTFDLWRLLIILSY